MKTYLVTGAAGFIGAAVARKLLAEENDVVTIDNLSTGKEEMVPENCVFIKGNDYDEGVIHKLDKFKFDAIIHIAGQSSGEISFENPVYDLQTNTQSTLMLLDYARRTNCKNFIFASSMSVYGDHDNPFVNEKTSTIPKSFYAVGKLASENYMRIYSNTYGIKCTALRFFNVYGVGQNMDNLKQGMASIFLAQAINDKHIVVKGSKDRFRDFVYIDDVVDAVFRVLDREGAPFEIYNVSSGVKSTVENIINEIQMNLPFEVSVDYAEGTPGDQFGIYGNYSKIDSVLGWKPGIDIKDGLSKMVEWALKIR